MHSQEMLKAGMYSKSCPKYPTGVTHYWLYFRLTETQRDSLHDNLLFFQEKDFINLCLHCKQQQVLAECFLVLL